MAASNVTLVGNVATAPEVNETPSGKKFVRFRVATNERYRDQAGEWKDHEPVFWDVEAWGDLAEAIGAQFAVGDAVVAAGPFRSQTWQTEQNEKRTRRYVKLDAIGPDLARPKRPAKAQQPEAKAPAATEPPADDWASES